MKTALLVPLVGLAISFALPTYAQQKDVADPQTTQKILVIGKAFVEAHTTTMPPPLPRYSRARRFCYARWANHRSASHSEMVYRPVPVVAPQKPHHKVDGNAYHLIGTAGNELWATGEWSETGQGKTGEPITYKGYHADIYVREGDDWKFRVDAWNVYPGQCHTHRQEFCTTTGRNAVPDRQP